MDSYTGYLPGYTKYVSNECVSLNMWLYYTRVQYYCKCYII